MSAWTGEIRARVVGLEGVERLEVALETWGEVPGLPRDSERATLEALRSRLSELEGRPLSLVVETLPPDTATIDVIES